MNSIKKSTTDPNHRKPTNSLVRNSLFNQISSFFTSSKITRKFLKYAISPFAVGFLVTCASTYISLVYYSNRTVTLENQRKDDHSLTASILQLHQKTIDWRLTDRGPIRGHDRVAILAIDEKSIEQEGRWPWSRDKQGKLVQRAIELGAKSVSFDIAYTESDPSAAIPSLRRVKRGLQNKGYLKSENAEIGQIIESEIGENDGDQVFSDVTKKNADHMILGSFFDGYERQPAYKDFCIDALFERSNESRYWKKESNQITVLDAPLNQLGFPRELKDHLGQFFTILETIHAQSYFEDHKELNQKIHDSLDELAKNIPENVYPGLATLWINNDVESTKELLGAIQPELANPLGVRLLFSRFGSAFTKKESATLTAKMREAGAAYCEHRFFTPKDDLLKKENMNLTGLDLDSVFSELSWTGLWKKLNSARIPANQNQSPKQSTQENENIEELIARIRTKSIPNAIPMVDRWWVNIPVIGDATKHTGFFNATLDSDGSIRKSVLFVRRGNSYMPSLAFKQFLTDKNLNAVAKVDVEFVGKKEVRSKILTSLEINDSQGNAVEKIPVDSSGHLLINYAGGRNMFPYISAADILSDDTHMDIELAKLNPETKHWDIVREKVDKAAFLKDKLLIAGATAIGIFDLRVTPFEENYPGVETHANILSNFLVEFDRQEGKPTVGESLKRTPASSTSMTPGFLQMHPAEEHTMWIVLVVLGLSLSALLSYFSSMPGLGITGLMLGGVYAIDKYYFFRSGIVTTVLFPFLEIFTTFVSLTFYKYFTEERKKRELKGTFEKYVSPSIVAEVLSDPENIELGGKKMDLTVMFSDVRGFTTISEKLDPRQLSDLLNSYLTPMTDLVFKNKGTLDKYMGDAIMAFWGAPIHFDDHAKHAARCALQMIDKLKVLQAEYQARGLPNIDIGIGLNTGDMSVGNMGSETVRSYTVMGDSVNLGSRLEGINKEYGTRIIISEFTQKAIQDSFITREVDWVRVKGKLQPVRIFELVCEGKAPVDKAELLEHFKTGFQLYHDRKFKEAIASFENGLKIDSEDPVTQLYIERCQDYLSDPPEENWDGVFTMTTK